MMIWKGYIERWVLPGLCQARRRLKNSPPFPHWLEMIKRRSYRRLTPPGWINSKMS